MAPPLALGDGFPVIQRHKNSIYPFPETAPLEYAPYRPHTTVQPLPTPTYRTARGAILEVLCRISEGFWFSPAELIMTSLFHFEDKVHRRNLTRAESIPLIFSRLLCQVLEHMGFPVEPRLERCRDCEAILTIDKWQLLPRA